MNAYAASTLETLTMSKRSLAWCGLILTTALLGGSTTAAREDKNAPALADLKNVKNVVYSADGSLLLVNYRGGTSRGLDALGVWDAKTGKFRVALDKPLGSCDRIALSPDGKKAAAIAVGEKKLKIWDTATGKLDEEQKLPEWKGSALNAAFLTFSPDGMTLYATYDKQILEAKVGGKNRFVTAKLDFYAPDEMAFDAAAKRFIYIHNIMGKPAAELRVYDVSKEGEPQKVALNDHVAALALSPDGKTLALSYLRSSRGKPRLELWDVPDFKLRATAPEDTRPDFQNYRAMAFAPDGKMLAGVPIFPKKNETVLDLLDSEAKIKQQITNKFLVTSVTFSPDGKTLAVILGNNTLLFVDPATGKAKEP
jgi:WD40 repeat protein